MTGPASAWLDDGDLRLLHGDALATLQTLPPDSYHAIVTSPPFYNLRDYGHADQIGLEDTPDAYVTRLVEVMREARRVLRRDGTLWLEIGDSYATTNPVGNRTGTGGSTLNCMREDYVPPVHQKDTATSGQRRSIGDLKPKDLIGIPWLLAFALRADGWYLRSEIIWEKPNCMPESVKDRPTRSHSTIFMLTKSPRYFFDAHAIAEPNHPDRTKTTIHTNGEGGHPNHQSRDGAQRWPGGASRNVRGVWTIPTESTSEAHFATMPQALAERCIKAGTSEKGCCQQCGSPWTRQIATAIDDTRAPARQNIHEPAVTAAGESTNARGSDTWGHYLTHTTTGWQPSCTCNAATKPCTVLDPFAGSGTTLRVARRLGRHADGIDLNLEYLQIAAQRIGQPTLWSEPA